jgi:hypothetical protein
MFVTIRMKTLNVMKDTMIFTNKTAFTQASMEHTVVYTTVYYIFRQYKKRSICLKDTNFSSTLYFILLSLKFGLLSSELFPIVKEKVMHMGILTRGV